MDLIKCQFSHGDVILTFIVIIDFKELLFMTSVSGNGTLQLIHPKKTNKDFPVTSVLKIISAVFGL